MRDILIESSWVEKESDALDQTLTTARQHADTKSREPFTFHHVELFLCHSSDFNCDSLFWQLTDSDVYKFSSIQQESTVSMHVCVRESTYLSAFSSLCQGAMMQQAHALMNPQCFVQHMQSKTQGFSICRTCTYSPPI